MSNSPTFVKLNESAHNTDVVPLAKLLTKKLICDLTGSSARYIELQTKCGKLRAVKFGNRHVRYRPQDVPRLD